MTWFGIIKNPKLRTSSKITTNLGSKTEEDDDSCEKKIKEYASKVGNFSLVGSILDGYSSWDYLPPELPEEVYCVTLKLLMQIQPNQHLNDLVELDIDYNVDVEYFYKPDGDDEHSIPYAQFSIDVTPFTNNYLGDYSNGLYMYLIAAGSEEEAMKEVDFR
jgi:hypothetical protein|tara:strand:+ start:1112 stop:1594 length:483 start_codon:yes stop_codon:yes gene_type:complete